MDEFRGNHLGVLFNNILSRRSELYGTGSSDKLVSIVDNNTVWDVAVRILENRQRMTNCATLTPIYKLLDSYF